MCIQGGSKVPFFEFKGSKIHYVDIDEREDKSKGFPLVFIHGTGASHSAWDEQLKAFCRNYRVIAIDFSGHGLSETRDDEKPSIQHGFVQELAALIEKLNLNNFVLIGHSMGGGVAMGYVLSENIRKPRAMTLVDTHSDLGISKEMMMGLAIEVAEILLSKTRMQTIRTKTRPHNGEDSILQSLPKNVKTIRRDLEACGQFDITGKIGNIDIPTFNSSSTSTAENSNSCVCERSMSAGTSQVRLGTKFRSRLFQANSAPIGSPSCSTPSSSHLHL